MSTRAARPGMSTQSSQALRHLSGALRTERATGARRALSPHLPKAPPACRGRRSSADSPSRSGVRWHAEHVPSRGNVDMRMQRRLLPALHSKKQQHGEQRCAGGCQGAQAAVALPCVRCCWRRRLHEGNMQLFMRVWEQRWRSNARPSHDVQDVGSALERTIFKRGHLHRTSGGLQAPSGLVGTAALAPSWASSFPWGSPVGVLAAA